MQGTSTVSFNGTNATTVTSWSATSIVVPVPAGATTGNVVVTVGGVATNGSPFTVTASPAITSLSPTSGGVGGAVTITGTNFGATQGASTVTFNGTAAATITSWSATSIVAAVPAGATTGNVVVTVGGVASNGSSFTVLPTPTITSLNPLSGAVGTAVTITGTNFGATQGSSRVTFNGTSAGTATIWSASSIVIPVPTGATTGNVVVTVNGVASAGSPFTAGPVITNLSQNEGPVATAVTITGLNFGATQSTSTVTFNGTAAPVTTWSNTSIVVPVPVAATSGPLIVKVGTLSSNSVTFTVGSPFVLSNCANAPTGDEAKLSGHYAFLMQGWNGTGVGTPFSTVTSFTANGTGGITGGEGDINGAASGAHHFTINATGGLYKVGKDPTTAGDIGCAVLPNSLGSSTTVTFSLGKTAGGVFTKGRIIEFDDTIGAGSRASGVLLLQTTPFAFPRAAVNLAFGESGFDASGNPFEGGGHFAMSTSGAFTNLSADFDDGGTLNFGLGAANPLLGATNNGGFVAAPDAAAGYAQFALHLTVGSNTNNFNYAAYQVNTNEYFIISTDAISASAPLAAGRAILTGSTFTNASLAGSDVIHRTGTVPGAASVIGLGLITFTTGSPAGTIGGSLIQYVTGSPASPVSITGGYTVASGSGRAVLTSTTGFGTDVPILYIATPNASTEPISAFAVGTEMDATLGLLEPSAGAGFTTAGANGNYFIGTENPGDNTSSAFIGALTVSGGAGACTGTTYSSGSAGLLINTIGGCTVNISNANGIGDVGSGSFAITDGEAIFFFVNGGSQPGAITVIETQ